MINKTKVFNEVTFRDMPLPGDGRNISRNIASYQNLLWSIHSSKHKETRERTTIEHSSHTNQFRFSLPCHDNNMKAREITNLSDIIYKALVNFYKVQRWKKHLLKRSLTKHLCWFNDNFVEYWTNRGSFCAKLFMQNFLHKLPLFFISTTLE